jgi:hypothetical protein
MKKIVASLFLYLILFSIGFNAAVWIYYELNIETLTAEYCLNKNKPNQDCKGKCQIEKILVEEQNIPLERQQIIEYLPSAKLFLSEVESFGCSGPTATLTVTPYINLYRYNFVISFLKPPQV